MKKFVVLFVVAAFTFFGSMAYAVDVTVSGSIDIRSRDFTDLVQNKDISGENQRDTQERIRINVDAKAGNDVKGRISIENNWDEWGRVEIPQGNGQNTTTDEGIPLVTRGTISQPVQLDIREAWISFNLPGIPVNVTGGHQLLQLGNGWWFRSMKYGSDAWVVANVTGNNTVAFVNIKAAEGNVARADDIDAYVILDVFKIDDNNVVGFDVTNIHDRLGLIAFVNGLAPLAAAAGTDLFNYSINYNGKLGPVGLKVQVDMQSGDVDAGSRPNFKGKEAVIEGKIPMDPLTINFLAAYGSGNKMNSGNVDRYANLLDADPHYTFLYEYKLRTGAGAQSTGFSNTEALNIGAMYKLLTSLDVGLDFWWLHAPELVALNGGAPDRDLGYEIDAKINWKLYDNLTWNWVLGYFGAGKCYDTGTAGVTTHSADATTGIQGVLSFKF
ncbi:MAG TPA: hypothetical protein VEM40_14640 [Nitrospirota bacterium]|nr:hypothetical protein [Nitrospirota bacterium]